MALFDTSSIIYLTLSGFTDNVTGSWYLTFLILTLAGIFAMLIFGLSLEWSVIYVFPLAMFCMLFSAEYITIGGTFIIYLGIIVAQNVLFSR